MAAARHLMNIPSPKRNQRTIARARLDARANCASPAGPTSTQPVGKRRGPRSHYDRAMTVRLNEEQRALRDAIRELADDKVAPRAAEIDQSAEFPWDMVQLLAQQDVLALPFPAEYGGLGGDLLTICVAIEQLSRACATTG